MVKSQVFLEGGGSGPDSSDLDIRCREGFRKLLEKCGLEGMMPRLIACGGRSAVFDRFSTANAGRKPDEYVAMLIDSEEPLADLEAAWTHLENVISVPKWQRPAGANDDQVLFMSTCTETWIVADRTTLRDYYGHKLQENALPPLVDLELRHRHDIQDRLERATSACSNAYSKGKRSFEVLGKVAPRTLAQSLPSFARVIRILKVKL